LKLWRKKDIAGVRLDGTVHRTDTAVRPTMKTISSAVAERPRDASCHWVFCNSLKHKV